MKTRTLMHRTLRVRRALNAKLPENSEVTVTQADEIPPNHLINSTTPQAIMLAAMERAVLKAFPTGHPMAAFLTNLAKAMAQPIAPAEATHVPPELHEPPATIAGDTSGNPVIIVGRYM
jgi:hypothetical protein